MLNKSKNILKAKRVLFKEMVKEASDFSSVANFFFRKPSRTRFRCLGPVFRCLGPVKNAGPRRFITGPRHLKDGSETPKTGPRRFTEKKFA